jgi:hypothetical protein
MNAYQTKSFRYTPQLFENWLNKTLWPPLKIKKDGGNYLVIIPAEKQSDTLLVISAYWLPDDESPRIEFRNGMYYQFDLDKDPQVIKEIILFDITQLPEDRIKVKVLWPDPAIEPYVMEILKVLFVDCPETDERQAQPIKQPEETTILETKKPEPWKQSRPKYRDRDKAIWESREDGNTWEDVAELADCGETTAKDNYRRLKRIAETN